MSGDIEKLAVFDSRIVQSRPRYAVEKGALSLTNAPFSAIAASSTQHTYNIYVPSENVYVDRAIEWTSSCLMSMVITNPAGAVPAGEAIALPGVDFALTAFPLNSLCSTLTATINDTTAVINSGDVLKEVLRLADYKKARLQRTCPTKLDTYATYDDCVGAVNNPIGGIQTQSLDYETPNGAWYDLVFTNSTGGVLTGNAAPAFGGANYDLVNGIPVSNGAAGPYTLYFKWRTTEKLVLSPFVFADTHEWDTGLFGINNIQLIMNLKSDVSRTIRSASAANGRVVSAVQFNTANPFADARVNVQFLTPSLDVPLPPKSVVPYMEFPRYISNPGQTISPGAVGTLQSQTITLPQIPDLFIIYAKPSSGVAGVNITNDDADFYLPVATAADGIRAPLTINFDNFSGLLSSHTAEELYAMCVKNGLEMDWNTWVGMGHSEQGTGRPGAGSGRVPLVGGLLVLKPSQDITLQTGQAPSLVGNFTFQFNIQVKNNTDVNQTPTLYVITANSGFFESIRGSSRIIKGVLSEQDIISAPVAPFATRDVLQRYVGSGLMSSMANMLSKAKSVYDATKPFHGAIAEAAKKGVQAYRGGEGGAPTGGAMTGGRSKKLSARLM